jgi:predicted ester cyclase
LDQLVAGDKVITRWTMTGHHQGTLQSELGPIEATGKAVTVNGITIDRVANGRIVERWHEADNLGMLQQLGAIPAPPR